MFCYYLRHRCTTCTQQCSIDLNKVCFNTEVVSVLGIDSSSIRCQYGVYFHMVLKHALIYLTLEHSNHDCIQDCPSGIDNCRYVVYIGVIRSQRSPLSGLHRWTIVCVILRCAKDKKESIFSNTEESTEVVHGKARRTEIYQDQIWSIDRLTSWQASIH